MSVISTPSPSTRKADAAGPVIVVGYDSSAEARLAVGVAAERAGPDGIVMPIHVAPDVPARVGAPYDRLAHERYHQADRAVLAEIAAIDTGFAAVEPDVFMGDPAETLVRIARERNAREIVVGTRGHGRIRSLLGSVSRVVLERADRPVVVVPRAAVAEDD